MTCNGRRAWLRVAAISGAAALAGAAPKKKEKEPEVTATEDLMREHGVLRRALIVYSEAAARLIHDSARVDPAALHSTALLFRDFGEQYHEKKLEEAYIFPEVKKGGGPAARYADILVVQHNRGREITDYILRTTSGARIGANAAELARVLDGMVRMYRSHAAREDTIVFPAWKKRFTETQLDELSDKFEDIEHQTFGKDGFDDAEKRIWSVEQTLGLADLAQFTAPPPPR